MPAFEIMHSARKGSDIVGTVRVARTCKVYGFTVLPDGRTLLVRGVNAIRPDHLRDVRHFLRTQFAAVAEVPAPAAPAATDFDRAAISAQALDGALPFIGHRPESVHTFLTERGYTGSRITGIYSRNGGPTVLLRWHAGDLYGYALAPERSGAVEAKAAPVVDAAPAADVRQAAAAAAEAARRDRLESEGYRFGYVAGRWVHEGIEFPTVFGFDTLRECMDDAEGRSDEAEEEEEAQPAVNGRRADGRTWADALAWRVSMRRPDGSRFDRAQRAITAEDARYLAALAEPGSTVLDVYAAEDAPDDAAGAQLAASPALAHADEWRTRRSTWVPLSVAVAAALVSFLPAGASAAGFDPGLIRAGTDPVSNALALALWCAFLALAACLVLACAGTVRHGRRERDAAVLRVRCRRIAGR